MPFRSLQQARWMFSQKPQMAKEWAKKTNFSKLPKRVKKHKSIKMPKGELIKEHSHLVKVLRSGKGLKKEANKQAKELAEYKKKKRVKK